MNYSRVECVCQVNGVTTVLGGYPVSLLHDIVYSPYGGALAMSAGPGSVNNLRDLNGRLTDANPGAPKAAAFSYFPNVSARRTTSSQKTLRVARSVDAGGTEGVEC